MELLQRRMAFRNQMQKIVLVEHHMCRKEAWGDCVKETKRKVRFVPKEDSWVSQTRFIFSQSGNDRLMIPHNFWKREDIRPTDQWSLHQMTLRVKTTHPFCFTSRMSLGGLGISGNVYPAMDLSEKLRKNTKFMACFIMFLTGWWLSHPSEKLWSSSVGMMTLPIWWESHKSHVPNSSQFLHGSFRLPFRILCIGNQTLKKLSWPLERPCGRQNHAQGLQLPVPQCSGKSNVKT